MAQYLQLSSCIVRVLRADERDHVIRGNAARHNVLGRRVHACARGGGEAVRHFLSVRSNNGQALWDTYK
jgi:hypothetical protein